MKELLKEFLSQNMGILKEFVSAEYKKIEELYVCQ